MTWTPDAPSTEEILSSLFTSSLPPLPAQESHVGPVLASWWELAPGEVYVHTEGGSCADRHYASVITTIKLEAHGYRRKQFDMDTGEWVDVPDEDEESSGFQAQASLHTAAWSDIMAGAKRLIMAGQVQLLRNGFNYIVGHVIGDHGSYDTEISRDDPNSRAITGWQCSCPWDQYAWQRTRKWKKFEGRPCKHVLSLFWKALSTPMDSDLTPEQQEAMGTGQKAPAPAVPDHPPEIEDRLQRGEEAPKPDLPRSFSPEGEIIQGEQPPLPGMPPDAAGGPPGPAQAPLAPPPSGPTPPGILPPFPGAQEEMPWGGPGTTPGGMKSPPGAYTVPGAKPRTPANPVQNPSTYSHLAAQFQAPQPVRAKKPLMGLAEGPVPGQYGDGTYMDVPQGTPGEVYGVDEVGGQTWIEVTFDLPESGPHEPYRVRVYCDPSDIQAAGELTPSDPAIRRHTRRMSEYRIPHQAPGPNDEGTNSPLHDLEGVMPDIYEHPEYYLSRGDPEFERYDREAWPIARDARGQPDKPVTVYRSAPVGEINRGDWVALHPGYAASNNRHPEDPAQDLPVFSAQVPASHLWNEGYFGEYGYSGPPITGLSPLPVTEHMAHATLDLMPTLGASTHATDSEVAFILQKYASDIPGPGHKLWFKVKPGRYAEPGRGMIHDPTGAVHTWPETEGTHASMIDAFGYRGQDCCRFYIQPSGVIGQIAGPSTAYMQVMRADPGLARANGMEPGSF